MDEYYTSLECGEFADVEGAIAEMNAKLEDAGLSTVLAEMQAQIDAWVAAKG